MILIYAGNHSEYMYFCSEHNVNPNEAKCIDRVEQIYGLHGIPLNMIGSCYLREDYPQITEQCLVSQIEINVYE